MRCSNSYGYSNLKCPNTYLTYCGPTVWTVFILHFYIMLNHKHCFLLWLYYVYQSMIILFRQFTFPPEKEKATHSSLLAWRIPWTVLSMGSQRVGHDWETFTFLCFFGIIDNMMMMMLLLLSRSVSLVRISSVYGILQARILEWDVISFSRGSSRPRDQTTISCMGKCGFFLFVFFFVFNHWAPGCVQIS